MRGSWAPGAIGLSLFLLLIGVGASAAYGQVVRGRLLDIDGTTAIGGAMMSLVDGGAQEFDRGLTRQSGLYQLVTELPGRYRVRADRIGYATTWSDYFEISAGDTIVVDVVARVEAISLAGIEAEGERRCRVRPEEGLAVTRLWDEARKALEAAAWTQDRGYYRYEMMGITREMDRENRRVISEDRSYDGGYRRAPYISLPAEELMEQGFARLTPVESIYWAPDAAVLLSDEFLDTHCFHVTRNERRAPGLIGLAFQPVRGRNLPEISGTLWIDPATAQLDWLDFTYRNLNLPEALMAGPIGGTVEFAALPNGTWIVDSWRIRMPRARTATNPLTGQTQSLLDGITVQGGDVLRVHGNEGTVLETDLGGRIAGAVFDSLRAGLPGARVYIEGTDIEVSTDRDGRFELARLEPGVYSVTFSAPYLDQYSFVPEPFEVEVVAEATTPAQINFAAPTMTRVIDNLCRHEERPEDTANLPGGGTLRNTGILIGQVTDTTGAAVAGVMVRVLSRDFDVGQDVSPTSVVTRTLRAGRSGVAARTNAAGFYRACWVPVDTRLRVSVVNPGEELDPARLQVGYNLTDLIELQEETVIIPSEVPLRTLDLRVRPR
ncbi:MAG: hypothetical protein F4205_06550 [Gemmatimonadetes bacterium]|nr:hypothetical protein [Gemmatimonadota bacterium]MXX72467.1 hypothetical protein [Gemmatimonadota bacterium]MYC92260.1 hypothetical protein [Gemmatimonadota bacterium]MYG35137.1 hypothetical protein [Gemmatimonadota bacterium]